jgi:hypothetical protein
MLQPDFESTAMTSLRNETVSAARATTGSASDAMAM